MSATPSPPAAAGAAPAACRAVHRAAGAAAAGADPDTQSAPQQTRELPGGVLMAVLWREQHLSRPRRRRSAHGVWDATDGVSSNGPPTRGCQGGRAEGAPWEGVHGNPCRAAWQRGDVRTLGLGLAMAGTASQDGPLGTAEALARLLPAVEELANRAEVIVAAALSIMALALAVSLLWPAVRCAATRRALSRRVALMVLPTDTFDPGMEDVQRYAAQIGRGSRGLRARAERGARGVRVRLDSVGRGQMVYRLEGPANALSVLKVAGYHETEIRPADDLDELALGALTDPRRAEPTPGSSEPIAAGHLDGDGDALPADPHGTGAVTAHRRGDQRPRDGVHAPPAADPDRYGTSPDAPFPYQPTEEVT